jgi:hypothetical protein
MLDLSTKSIEWIFSGIGVAILGVIAKWLWGTRGKGDTNIGSHNRAGRDQNITIDTTGRDKTGKD